MTSRGSFRAAACCVSFVAAAHAQPSPRCAAPADGVPARVASAGEVEVRWRTLPDPVPIGRPFAVVFDLCPRRPSTVIDRVSVDAWMPAHRHGMNYRPTLDGAPPGPIRADGLLLHMAGHWQLVFELRADGRPLRLTDDLTPR